MCIGKWDYSKIVKGSILTMEKRQQQTTECSLEWWHSCGGVGWRVVPVLNQMQEERPLAGVICHETGEILCEGSDLPLPFSRQTKRDISTSGRASCRGYQTSISRRHSWKLGCRQRDDGLREPMMLDHQFREGNGNCLSDGKHVESSKVSRFT